MAVSSLPAEPRPPVSPLHVPFDEVDQAPVEEALYFLSAGRHLFGWLHRCQSGSRSHCGVLLCQPFGYEAICAHRSMRALCNAIARAGLPAMRFDYAGTGDSEDLPIGADQVIDWIDDIRAAVGELQRRCGVSAVCLLGLRWGALLASLASEQCASVSALALLAPPAGARALLREMQLQSWQDGSHPRNLLRGALPPAAPAPTLELGGFGLSAASIASLQGIDRIRLPTTVEDVLIVDRMDIPGARGWARDSLSARVRTEYQVFSEYADMMKPPQFAHVPETTIAAIRAWLGGWQCHCRAGGRPRAGTISTRPAETLVPAETAVSAAIHDPAGNAAVERPVWLGPASRLFGILTDSPAWTTPRGAVLFLNAGGDHHIGPGRLHVALARRWSSLGYVVLRLDLMGLGDSGPPGSICPAIFSAETPADVGCAIDWLCHRYGVQPVILCGLCSGAFHALRTALVDARVQQLLLVNLNIPRSRQDSQLGMSEAIGSTRRYRERLLAWQSWRKLISGQLDLGYLVRTCRERVWLALCTHLRGQARRLGLPLHEDLGLQLRGLARRGVDLQLLYASGDPGIELLAMQAGSMLQELRDQRRLHFIDGADHGFTAPADRMQLEDKLTDVLHVEHPVRMRGLEAQSPSASGTTRALPARLGGQLSMAAQDTTNSGT